MTKLHLSLIDTKRFVFFSMLLTLVGNARADLALVTSRVATGLSRPVYVTAPPADQDRLFIVEQHTGRIKILNLVDGTVNAAPFLDLGGLSTGNEQGLLGLAFHPDYATNGQFYVNLTDSSGRTNIRRYTVSADPDVANSGSAQTVLRYSQPQSNHNGGWMGFGPSDGLLYIGTGDGGAANDSGGGHTSRIGNAQDLTNNLLGKMLRIDVNGDDFLTDNNRNYAIPPSNPFVGGEGDDEIWAYGLRNPWRASFDRLTHDLYIGDVGQNAREEIDFQPASSRGGENYGWRLREGMIQTPSVGGDPPTGAIEPIHDFPHTGAPEGGFSVTGGYVYRGPSAELQGHYFFADFVSNQVWSLRFDGANVTDFTNRTSQFSTDAGSIESISSFGEDASGNLYIVSLEGDVFRLDRVAERQELVAAGALWKYLDDGSDQATAWREAAFDDSPWQEGPAQLGYGDRSDVTQVGFGPDRSNRFITTYFRHQFDVADPSLFESLTLELLRDDGAAVYLNGTEIVRTDNLAPAASFDVLANFNNAGDVRGLDERTFFKSDVDTGLLIQGTNFLAVEVHQHSAGSTDLSFDLQLRGILVPEPATSALVWTGSMLVFLVGRRRGRSRPCLSRLV